MPASPHHAIILTQYKRVVAARTKTDEERESFSIPDTLRMNRQDSIEFKDLPLDCQSAIKLVTPSRFTGVLTQYKSVISARTKTDEERESFLIPDTLRFTPSRPLGLWIENQ